MDWTEGDIQALKAQEAKDLAVELLQKLAAKEIRPDFAGRGADQGARLRTQAARGRERRQSPPRGSRAKD